MAAPAPAQATPFLRDKMKFPRGVRRERKTELTFFHWVSTDLCMPEVLSVRGAPLVEGEVEMSFRFCEFRFGSEMREPPR